MKAQRKNIHSYVLVYSDDCDPSREETAEVLDHLSPLPAEEILPGTIRVQGPAREVRRCAGELAHWRLSQEKILSLNPPHKAMRR
ncbi:MAG: hypothetical protein Q4G14_05125 [Paracoccus sp. (in: a-proteobacteria)]|uniref:hypothetical protein n=1 Tax=Paracoccus sp. TaxID=267 RepID=UPI0026DEB26A|nr:hypothetical protein [Paracoccus sp. (in: a-proteobacteria)]MDO5612608.1 hypothetical protein [Paracoccus sp. (in: a-proteobacteria)]MDO5631926.1 hypothetical protein [Paracoccus sp. (in: a-proteobacteria)]